MSVISPVVYYCHCGKGNPCTLDELCYCRNCSEFACQYCVILELGNYVCATCLTTSTTTEAWPFRNRCPKCFQCPSCDHLLSIVGRDTAFFFSCGYCRWNSQRLGLMSSSVDKLIHMSLFAERDHPNEKEVSRLVEGLRQVRNALTREQVVYKSTRAHLTSIGKSLKQVEQEQETNLGCPVVNGESLQWGDSLEDPAEESKFPKRQLLMTRTTKRCGTCELPLIMFNPMGDSAALKIGHVARVSVTRITIMKKPQPFRYKKWTPVLLLITSPVSATVKLQIAPRDLSLFPPSSAEPLAQVMLNVETELASFDDDINEYPSEDKVNGWLTEAVVDPPAEYESVVWANNHRCLVLAYVSPVSATAPVKIALQAVNAYSTAGDNHLIEFSVDLSLGKVKVV